MVLGIMTVGFVVVVAGPIRPASADLIFGDCKAIVGPILGSCPGDTKANVLNWSSPITGSVTTESFLKSTLKPGGTTQFVDSLDGPNQSGLGITSQVGANLLDNEITNFPVVANFISISPASTTHTGTITIDSLQSGETAEVCAEPTAGVFGGAFCVDTVKDGAVAQTLSLPAAFGPALPVLAVDATVSPLSDVKIRDFDLTVPEPATVGLFLAGMVGLVFARRRRNLI
jgi:hypothetical protein